MSDLRAIFAEEVAEAKRHIREQKHSKEWRAGAEAAVAWFEFGTLPAALTATPTETGLREALIAKIEALPVCISVQDDLFDGLPPTEENINPFTMVLRSDVLAALSKPSEGSETHTENEGV